MPVTKAQIEFWEKLLHEKQFPPESPPTEQLRDAFSKLNKKSASEWIDKALKLPDAAVKDEPLEAPPF